MTDKQLALEAVEKLPESADIQRISVEISRLADERIIRLREEPPGGTSPRMSDKQFVMDAVRDLPESADIQRISDEISLLAAIRRGKEDVAAGRVHSHEEIRQMIQGWKAQITN